MTRNSPRIAPDLSRSFSAIPPAEVLDRVLACLAELPAHHAPDDEFYQHLAEISRKAAKEVFGPSGPQTGTLGSLGAIRLPYNPMGAIDSVDLFGLDELIIFAFYRANRDRYRRVVDAGANLGLHSIVMSRCGFEVRAYEPDPIHFQALLDNLEHNGCTSVAARPTALSTAADKRDFVRVLGNTTGSHLAGSKETVYGPTDLFQVETEPFAPLLEWADLVKMDVEGHEAAILRSTTPEQWTRTDALIEVGSARNATDIFTHFAGTGINLFAQKLSWGRVIRSRDMPSSYREGSLFLTCKESMPWPMN